MAKDTYIEEDLLKDIQAFCELNGLKPAILINVWVREGFMKQKWGSMNGPKLGLPDVKQAAKSIVPDLETIHPKTREEEIEDAKKADAIIGRNSYGGPQNKKDLYGE